MRRDVKMDVLVIELNGMSQVSRAIAVVDGLTRLDSVIGVMDAGAVSRPLSSSLEDLAQTCDVICLNKASECTAEDVSGLRSDLLRGNGKLQVLPCNFGKIPVDRAFRLKRTGFVQGQMSVREARQSSRYVLIATDQDECSIARPVLSKSNSQERHDVDTNAVKWKLLVGRDRAITLPELQDLVVQWHKSSGLRRIKGTVWLQVRHGADAQSYEFHFSGRTRLQCTCVAHAVSSQSRLAVVSTEEADFADLVQGGLHNFTTHCPAPDPTLRELEEDNRICVFPGKEDGVIEFQITCLKKFGFSQETLSQRFGVDLHRVNFDFHARFNAAPGPELVAFDGEHLFLCAAHFNKDKFNRALHSIVDLHFSVVKLACRCDS